MDVDEGGSNGAQAVRNGEVLDVNDEEEKRRMFQEAFESFLAEGNSPNEAAAKALASLVRQDRKEKEDADVDNASSSTDTDQGQEKSEKGGMSDDDEDQAQQCTGTSVKASPVPAPSIAPPDPEVTGPIFSAEEMQALYDKVGEDGVRPIVRRIGAVFSDPLHLIASFGSEEKFPNLSDARLVFKLLADCDKDGSVDNSLRNALSNLGSQMKFPFTNSPEKQIIPSLVVLEYDAFQYDAELLNTMSSLLYGIASSRQESKEHLRSFWKTCDCDYLLKTLGILQMFTTLRVAIGAEQGKEVNFSLVKEAIILIDILHDINKEVKEPFADYTDFYNSAINEQATADDYLLRLDLSSWFGNHRTSDNVEIPDAPKESFCDYPFLLDPGSKARILQLEARVQQHTAVSMARMSLRSALMPYFVIRVRREEIVNDVLDIVAASNSEDFKKPLRVKFVGEDGVDEGGVQKEFFLLMVRKLLDPNYGMFVMDDGSRKLWFNPNSFEGGLKFELVGIILGLAIYNGVILDLAFPTAMYRKLLNYPCSLQDLRDLHPQLGKGLKDLLNFDGDVEETFYRNFQISYELFGEVKTVDLIENGENIAVTKENRKQYVDLYVDYILNTSVENLFARFKQGFMMVADGVFLHSFHPEEMELLLCGSTNLDIEELEATCRYEGYTKDSEVMRNFWEIMKELPAEKQKQFLQFTTGSDRIPIRGLSTLRLTIAKNSNSDQLPTSSTCFNYLILPAYDSKDKLREKLLLAIEHSEGFGTL